MEKDKKVTPKPKGLSDVANLQTADHIKITDKSTGKELVNKRG